MTSFCSQACIICDIDGFTGRNAGPVPNWDQPNGFCAPIAHNLRWIGFIAGSPSLTLEIAVSNCTRRPLRIGGLQMGLYQANDCEIVSSGPVSNCDDDVRQGQVAVLTTTTPLVVGQYYFLVIDGRNNDVCDYSVTVTNGSTAVGAVGQGGGISGPATLCAGGTGTYATNPVPGAPNHYWTLDGAPLPGSGGTYDVTFPAAGTYEVCVAASNTCSTSPEECMTVTVTDIPETIIPGVTCSGNCFEWEGVQFCNPGSFSYNFQSAQGCDSLVTLEITQLNAVAATLDTAACFGASVDFRGTTYGPGAYTLTLPAAPGDCDTTLTLIVTELPDPSTSLAATICLGDAYPFGTQVLTSAGVYTETFTTAAGCDSTVTLELTVEDPVPTGLTETVCAGGSITIGTTTYSSSGSYTDVLQTANGCDSTVTLDLTVLPVLTGSEVVTVCAGQSFTLGGTTFSSSGTYTEVLRSVNGCDSTVTLELTVLPPNTTAIGAEICDGQTYPFNGSPLGASGTYSATFASAAGCDSVVTLTLVVLAEIVTSLSASICPGESFPFNGASYATAGTYSATLPSAGGCDSTVNLSLTVAATPTTALTEVVCEGESVLVGSTPYSTTGTYTEVLTSAAGCDSTVTLDLTVLAPVTEQVSASICEGGSYVVGGTPFSASGTYTVPLQSAAGCDSTVVLALAVNPEPLVSIVAEICAGDQYLLGTQQIDATGFYTEVFASAAGCDSTVDLDLTVVQEINTTEFASICPGETYLFNGTPYASTGSYPFTAVSAAGCDSVVTLELEVAQPSAESFAASICEGESFAVGAEVFSASGAYTVVLPAVNGCDSTVTLDLTVNAPRSAAIAVDLCAGDTYVIDGTVLRDPGVYNFTLATAAGCDSLVEVTVGTAPTYYEEISATVCPGTGYSIGGQTFTGGGTYSVLLSSYYGCDSLIVLSLFEEAIIETEVARTICEGDFFVFAGVQRFDAGTYYENFVTAAGCDSLVTLELSVVTALTTNLAETICTGESVFFDGAERTAAGTYSFTTASAAGCDSTVTLELSVVDVSATQLDVRLCAGETYAVGPQTFDESGVYSVTLANAAGCDSVITLDLLISGGDTTLLAESICAGGEIVVGSERFSTTGTYFVDVPTAAGCDSTVRLDLTVAQAVALSQNESLCDGASVEVRGTNYAAAGTYVIALPGTGGACDTTLTLTIATGQSTTSSTVVSICAGETYAFAGQVLSESGVYVTPYTSTTGCDSVRLLDLTVLPARDTALAVAICSGEAFEVGGQRFTETGTYTVDLASASGCDSTVTLDLSVAASVALSQNERFCSGGGVEVRGETYDAPGTYVLDLPGSPGACDTVLTLVVAEAQPALTELEIELCAGETYPFDGRDLAEAGTYVAELTTVGGCDSTVTLTLDVVQGVTVAESGRICAGDTYAFNGSDLGAAGTYEARFTAANGCDSVITLDLSVGEATSASIDAAVCTGEAYVVGAERFTDAGTYTVSLTNAAGCDSTVTLRLGVVDEIVVEVAAEICAGATYTFGGRDLTEAGTYEERGASVAGCDSVTRLTLAVVDEIRTEMEARVCAGDSYAFDGSALTDAGTYSATYASASGCDSTVTLVLGVDARGDTSLAATICSGDAYGFAGQTLTAAGDYAVTLTNRAGCDSTVALSLNVVDVIEVALEARVCRGQTYRFDGDDLGTAGTYTARGVSYAGCDSVTTLTLAVDDEIRVDLAARVCAGERYDFAGQSLGLSGTYTDVATAFGGCDSVTTLALTVDDALVGDYAATLCAGETLRYGGREFTAAGQYSVVLTATTGCDSTIALTLTYEDCGGGGGVTASADPNAVDCFGGADGSLALLIVAGAPPLRVSLTDEQGATVFDSTLAVLPSASFSVGGLPAGEYLATIRDADGEETVLRSRIGQPLAALSGDLSVASDYNGRAISCAGALDGSVRANLAGGTPPYDYAWSTGQTGSALEGLGAGVYALDALDANGCPWGDQVALTEPPPIDFALVVEPIACDAPELGGAIGPGAIAGGTPPLRMRLGDADAAEPSRVAGLAAGTYVVLIEDANGCARRDSATLDAPETPKLDLGADRELILGDTFQLRLATTVALSEVAWTSSPPSYLSCDDCAEPRAAPGVTTSYVVTGLTESGCPGEASLTLRVRVEDGVFVPTAFSPDGDGVNDRFTVYAQDELAEVVELRVFDRWGEAVWAGVGFAAGVPELGWDGTFRGEAVNPGVFVYYARVRLRSGREVELAGDVAVVR